MSEEYTNEFSEVNRGENFASTRGQASAAKVNGSGSTKQLIRDITFKARFRYNYGFDESFYNFSLRYKDIWQDKLFFVDEKLVAEEEESTRPLSKSMKEVKSSQLRLQDMEGTKLSPSDITKHFQINNSLVVKVHKASQTSEKSLQFGSTTNISEFLKRNTMLANVGGHITCIRWLPSTRNAESEGHIQYLAVSVINSSNENFNNPSLSIFNKTTSSDSKELSLAIQIWQYNTVTENLLLYKLIVTSAFGAASEIAWAPISVNEEQVIGILVGIFTDGRIHILKILSKSTHEAEYFKLSNPSLSYEQTKRRQNGAQQVNDYVPATCFDFLGDDKIVVGHVDGSIAEYVFPHYSSTEGEMESDPAIPSYVKYLSDSAITTLTVAQPSSGHYFLLVNTSGSQSLVLDYNNTQQGRVELFPINTLLKPIYNGGLKVLLVCDGWENLSYTFLRHPHEKPSSTLKLDGIISSFHLSEYNSHPLVLSGTTYGEIHILNIARKILNGSKATNKLLVPLRLWKLEIDTNDNSLVLKGDLNIDTTDKATHMSVSPPEMIISALGWNESPKGSSVYTAGTLSGLMILERLDPQYSRL